MKSYHKKIVCRSSWSPAKMLVWTELGAIICLAPLQSWNENLASLLLALFLGKVKAFCLAN